MLHFRQGGESLLHFMAESCPTSLGVALTQLQILQFLIQPSLGGINDASGNHINPDIGRVFISLKYRSILVSHPNIARTWLLVYFSSISNFNPPILAPWGMVGVDVAVVSNEGLVVEPPTIPKDTAWIGMLGVKVRDRSIGGS